MPAMMILESDDSFFVVGPHYQFSLADMLRFRQGGLTQSVTRRLFVVYQLLKVVEHLHSKGLTLGGSKTLHRDSVFMDELLWLRVMPSSVIAPSPPASLVRRQTPFYSTPSMFSCSQIYFSNNKNLLVELDHPTDRWIRGDISNFEYLLYVNHAAGRRSGNPVFHPAMPWVIEFVAQRLEDEVFRDMTRTKFRLNKGTCGLLFFNFEENAITQVMNNSISRTIRRCLTTSRTFSRTLPTTSTWLVAHRSR